REQQKHKIDGLTVERLELHGPFESRKQSEQLIELRQLAVRNGDAVTDAGRTELLALLQNLQDRSLALAAELGGLGGQLLQNLLLAVDLERRNDGVRRDEIGEKHGPFPKGLEVQQGRRRKGGGPKVPAGRPSMGVRFDCREINPADMTVGAAINQMDAAMSSVTEHERRSPP